MATLLSFGVAFLLWGACAGGLELDGRDPEAKPEKDQGGQAKPPSDTEQKVEEPILEHAGQYRVTANVDFIVKLKGRASASLSADAREWQPVKARKGGEWLAIDISPAAVGKRELWLRAK